MLGNVSFGILAFTPLGLGLMLVVVLLEGVLLARTLAEPIAKRHFGASLVANAASGAVGFVVSLGLTGGWWLVIWVPWVTAAEASREQWPSLAAFMGVAFIGSVGLELLVVRLLVRQVPFWRLFSSQLVTNLVSSLLLLGLFWWMGGVPGTNG